MIYFKYVVCVLKKLVNNNEEGDDFVISRLGQVMVYVNDQDKAVEF